MQEIEYDYGAYWKDTLMDQTTASQVDTAELARLLRVIANPLRLEILFCLLERPRCVCELAEEFNCRQPNISQNLMRLRRERLVSCRKDGWNIWYSLSSPKIHYFLESLLSVWGNMQELSRNSNDEECQNNRRFK
jgi:DNA-binding transcriptional ArsR family regulator